MQPSRALLAICAVFVGTACDDTTPTGPGALGELPTMTALDLDVRAPELKQEMFVQYEAEVVGSPDTSGGAQRFSWPEVEIWGDQTAITTPPLGFVATGLHHYIGNKSSVETTLRVKFGNDLVGEQTGIRERTVWVNNPFTWSEVRAEAVVHTRGTCGLRATASSVHRAAIQLFPGPAILEVFPNTVTSFAQPIVLPACAERLEGSPGGATEDGEEVTCWFNVTYDLQTGEVLSRELLWCSGGNGGLD